MPPANAQNVQGCGHGFIPKDDAIEYARSKSAKRSVICALLFQTDEFVEEEICGLIRQLCCLKDPETPPEGIKGRVDPGATACYYDWPHGPRFRTKVGPIIDKVIKAFPSVFKQSFYKGGHVATVTGQDEDGQDITEEAWHLSSDDQQDVIYTLIKDQCKRLLKDPNMRDPDAARNVDRRVALVKSPKKDAANVEPRVSKNKWPKEENIPC
jgi:hypothetical protein